jgi:hypothetical protein
MSQATVQTAQAYVNSIELPAPMRAAIAPPKDISFDALKNQALVVGSDVVSFVKGVSAERKQDIVNAALLAQLAASKRVPDRSDVFAWYNAYFDVLTNLGWVIQDTAFDSYEEQADGLTTHEAILKVAAVLLGASPTALAVITATVEAMKSMDKDNPWITIFERESRSAESARFQIALAEEDEAGRFMVSMMAFGLRADSTITQVLFFKIRSNRVTLKHCSGKVTINEDVLAGVRAAVKAKLVDRTAGYIDSLDI